MIFYQVDTEVAMEVGVNSALFLGSIAYWIEKNKNEGRHLHNGRYWTYNTVESLTKQFPFWSYDQIRGIINKLRDEYLMIDNFNKSAYDRTRWYSLTDKGMMLMRNHFNFGLPVKDESICENNQIHLGKITNENGVSPRPIPNNNQIYNQIYNKDIVGLAPDHTSEKEKIPYQEVITYLNEKAGKNFRVSSAKTKKLIRARFNDGFTLDDFKRVIDTKVFTWGNDAKMSAYLRPETLFGTKFEGYLNETSKNNEQDSSAIIDIGEIEWNI